MHCGILWLSLFWGMRVKLSHFWKCVKEVCISSFSKRKSISLFSSEAENGIVLRLGKEKNSCRLKGTSDETWKFLLMRIHLSLPWEGLPRARQMTWGHMEAVLILKRNYLFSQLYIQFFQVFLKLSLTFINLHNFFFLSEDPSDAPWCWTHSPRLERINCILL